MKVILLTNVPKLGKIYEVKDVNDGFARNFLIPSKKAEMATPAKIASLEENRKKHEEQATTQRAVFTDNIKALEGKTLTLSEKANDQGHLFAAIRQGEIVSAIADQLGTTLTPELVLMEGSLKEVGEHTIIVGDADTKATITLTVVKSEE